MALPRMAAIAEVVWSDKSQKNWDDFLQRLLTQFERYDQRNINYAKSVFNVSIKPEFNPDMKNLLVSFNTQSDQPEIHYTLDGLDPNIFSAEFNSPFSIDQSVEIKAASFINEKIESIVSVQRLNFHKAFGMTVSVTTPYAEQYSAGGEYALVDGIAGSEYFMDGRWQGYEFNDFEAVVDLDREATISEISSRFYQKILSWIFLPESVEYFVIRC